MVMQTLVKTRKHNGKRSSLKHQARLARNFVLENCFRDKEIDEVVNLKTDEEIREYLKKNSPEGGVLNCVVDCTVQGEVLLDSSLTGSWQTSVREWLNFNWVSVNSYRLSSTLNLNSLSKDDFYSNYIYDLTSTLEQR